MAVDGQGEPILDLSNPNNVVGILPENRGGTSNRYNLARGLYTYGFIKESSVLAIGTVVVCDAGGEWTRTTTLNAQQATGVIVESNVVGYSEALIQIGGIAEVLTTGSVETSDRMQTSTTTGTAASISTATGSGFARAITDDYSGRCKILMEPGANFPFSIIDHGAIGGLTDDDHTQYLSIADLGTLGDQFLGATCTSTNTEEAFSTGDVSNLVDGDDGTAWDPNDTNVHVVMDLGSRKSFNMITVKQTSTAITTIQVQFSTAGTSGPWTTAATAPASGRTSTSAGIVTRRFYTLPGITAQYIKLNFNGGASIAPRFRTISAHNIWTDKHPLLSATVHYDTTGNAATSNQIVGWQSATSSWLPMSAGITSNGSNFLPLPGTVNLQAGPGIALDVAGSTVTIFNVASGSGSGGSIAVQEVDGSPSDAFTSKIIFPNGTISFSGHEATYAPIGLTGSQYAIQFVFDGGTSVLTGNPTMETIVPATGTIVSATLLADTSGSAVVDVLKSSYSGYAGSLTSITASAKPTLSSAIKSQDSTLTGWTTSITAGDVLRARLDSSSTVTHVVLVLMYTRS